MRRVIFRQVLECAGPPALFWKDDLSRTTKLFSHHPALSHRARLPLTLGERGLLFQARRLFADLSLNPQRSKAPEGPAHSKTLPRDFTLQPEMIP